jgi:hypothetical protein
MIYVRFTNMRMCEFRRTIAQKNSHIRILVNSHINIASLISEKNKLPFQKLQHIIPRATILDFLNQNLDFLDHPY